MSFKVEDFLRYAKQIYRVANHYIKVTGCLSFCLYLRILLTAEPKWFSFIVLLLIGSGKVLTLLGEDTTTLRRKVAPRKKPTPKKTYFFFFEDFHS